MRSEKRQFAKSASSQLGFTVMMAANGSPLRTTLLAVNLPGLPTDDLREVIRGLLLRVGG
jgi:hypothetical protein